MANVHETAMGLHRELCRRGLQLNPKIGRDAALHSALARKLGVPADGFSKAIKNSGLSAEDYLRALIEVAQPFSHMFHEIWSYLAKHSAPKAGESLLVRFGFDNDRTEIDWDQFRKMVKSARKVWAVGPIVAWPLDELFGLANMLPHSAPNWRNIPGGYASGRPFTLPEVQVIEGYDEVGHRVCEAMQSWIDAVYRWSLDKYTERNLPELIVSEEFNSDAEHERNIRFLSSALHDLIPRWLAILGNWDLIGTADKKNATDYYERNIAPKLRMAVGASWRSALEALDILDLPFWRHRWHTYEIWAAIKALEALHPFHPVPVITNGHIALDAANPALVAKLSAAQTVFAHVQSETKLEKPLGKRKGIKPDLRFSIDEPPTNAGTIAIVEFKQRSKLDDAHASEVLKAYSQGAGLGGGVVLINYDAIPKIPVPARCDFLGDVHPGKPDNVRTYQEAVRRSFARANVIPLARKRFVLMDVSGSMGSEYESEAAQRGLKRLLMVPWVKVFRFNDGLEMGGDLKSDRTVRTGGGTLLGAALGQLFSLADGGVPERLLVVTDGGHDHPDELLRKCGAYIECTPEELENRLDWLNETEP